MMEHETTIIAEVRRIRSMAWLAFVLFLLVFVLDGPVTMLGVALLGTGTLATLYVAVSATISMRKSNHH